jgi:hypothetical protein
LIETRAANWTVLAAAFICFAACGKKEAGTPTPVLSPPNAVEKVPVQAEVKASSGPVELSFLLHKTQIKVDDYLWQQIRIRNIGEKMFVVADQVFHDPRDLRDCSRSAGSGIYIEALGPDGKRLKVEFQSSANQDSDQSDEVSGLLEVKGPEEQAMLAGWKKQGLNPQTIDRKLLEFNMNKRVAKNWKRQPVIKLLPGQSVETKSAFFYSTRDEINEKPVPQPIGDFAQIDFFHFDKPGQYKVRAVYDHLPGELTQKHLTLRTPDDVLIHTPWVAVTVLP